MIILPIHKKIEDEIITAQLREWLYQSHCWDAPNGLQGLKICKWCKARSTLNAIIDKGQHFCPDNPIVSQIFAKAVQIARKDPAEKAADIKEAEEKKLELEGWQDEQ